MRNLRYKKEFKITNLNHKNIDKGNKKKDIYFKSLSLSKKINDRIFDSYGVSMFWHYLRIIEKFEGIDYESASIILLNNIFKDTDTKINYLKTKGYSKRIIDGILCLTKNKNENIFQYYKKIFSNKDSFLVKKILLIYFLKFKILSFFGIK